MTDEKSRKGYRVVGKASVNSELKSWEFDSIDDAHEYAQFICTATNLEVDIMKYVGSWKVSNKPTEFISATDRNTFIPTPPIPSI